MSTTYYAYTSQPLAYRTVAINTPSTTTYRSTVPRSLYHSYEVEGLMSRSANSSVELGRSQTQSRGVRTYVPGRGAQWLGGGETTLSRQEVRSNAREARWLPGGNTTKSHVRLEGNASRSLAVLGQSVAVLQPQRMAAAREPVLRTYVQQEQPQQHARTYRLAGSYGREYAPTVSYRTAGAEPMTYSYSTPATTFDTSSARVSRSYVVGDVFGTSARMSSSYADPLSTSARMSRSYSTPASTRSSVASYY